MAKKKRKSTKRDPEAAERNKRIAIGAAIVIGGVSVFVGTAMGVSELDQRGAKMIATTDPAVDIVFPTNGSGESWMPNSERIALLEITAHAVIGTKALSSLPLELVGKELVNTGWSEGSPDVRWTSDGRITATVNWRRPAAVVRIDSREYLIDWNAHLLPLSYSTAKSNQFYFTNASGAMPKLGQVWAGEDLRDGLALQQLLSENGLIGQVEGIDLGEGGESGTLSIRTNRGAKIIWGGGPGQNRPGEQPTSTKLARLKQLFEQTGRVDASVGLLDIRGTSMMLLRHED